MTRTHGSTNTRRRVKEIEASRFAGHDFSIPDEGDHDKHLRDVLRAAPRGFPWLIRGNA